ncbi:MAG: hypothetical protein HQL24_02665 [Candidatus Omnitrophica bacterium]|nr:hypothetical protein [Candidatus Omnitrophota bacterium]
MKKQLDDLQLKKKKLLFLLGEAMSSLYKAQKLRVLYTSDAVDSEAEVLKLLRLMEHLQDKIKKLEASSNS